MKYSLKKCENEIFDEDHWKRHLVQTEWNGNVNIKCPCGLEFTGKSTDNEKITDFLCTHFPHSNGFHSLAVYVTHKLIGDE